MGTVTLRVNGETLSAEGLDPHTTLLHLLRERGLTGTKEGCAEGECGACAVVLVRPGEARPSRFEPVNSCLLLAAALDGHEVWTAEGFADGDVLHPVQDAMASGGGSQCGYCTPGFVVSLFAEYYREGRNGYDPEGISGNLCRCTGYRPIRDAAKSLGQPEPGDRFLARLGAPPPSPGSFEQRRADSALYRPATLEELFRVLEQAPGARIVAGGTDVVVGINQSRDRHPTLVALDALEELRFIDRGGDALVIGAGVSLGTIEHALRGELPILDELFPLFSSRLIRNRATLGGNLVNASPIGDSPPALLALDAELVLARRQGERTVPLDGFFTGYRKTILEPGEIVKAVRIPRPYPTINRFYKVSKRILDDISTVAAGFGLTLAPDGTIAKARLAYGGVAATPIRAKEAERAITGKPWTPETIGMASEALERAFNPITDQRGSAVYRRAMVTRLLDKLWTETQRRAS